MNKSKNTKKLSEMTSEEKEEYINELRRTANTNEPEGPLKVYGKYHEEQKQKGRVTAIIDTTRIGRVDELLNKGWKVDDTSDFTSDSYANAKTTVSSTIDVNLSSNREQRGIVMSIDQDTYDKMQLMQQIKNEQLVSGLTKTGIATQTGEITIGNKKLK